VAGIVVGVDGSEASKAALRWALDEARLRGAPLRVLYAWAPPLVIGPGVALPETDQVDAEAEGERMLDSAIAELGAEGVDVERAAVRGLPSRVLVEAAGGADLLVVGSRGHGGFAELLLGSVSHQCAHHAPCPVVIVRR
jgi:nucleotide-binding universal stress UspA family protein